MKRRQLLTLAGTAAGLSLAAGFSRRARADAGYPQRLEIGRDLPDPFCIRHGAGWYLTGTHSSGYNERSEKVYDMYFSKDLRKWEPLGPVLAFPEFEGSREANYWAPEIAFHGGRWYMYYTADSFGINERRYVRAAVADRIEGPYHDAGQLTAQPAIDGDPVWCSAEEGYLFYTGNEGNPHVGQLLADRFVGPERLAGQPQRVFPGEDQPWEEGAFVVREGEKFYLFSSMGNWRDGSYHVLVARADHLPGPWERLEGSLLESRGGDLLGPGHNSVFAGPDGGRWICFHAWDAARTGRYPWIAPLDWKDGRPVVRG